MKRIVIFAAALVACVCVSCGPASETVPVRKYEELPLGDVKADGWLKTMLERQRDGITADLDKTYPPVMGERNGWLGGAGDHWARGPSWIDGLIPLAYILDDDSLKAKAQLWVEWALASQREDGFFGPSRNYPSEKGLQRGNSEDWWPRMVVLKFMQQYYDATGDARVLDFMERYFRYQLETLPDKPIDNWTDWAAFRVCDNMIPVLWLYGKTGEEWLLDLVELMHSQGHDYTGMFLESDALSRPGTIHCVNLAQGIKEPAVYWQIHPEKRRYLDAVYKGLADLVKYNGYPSGAFGGDEALHGNNPVQGSELCAIVELMYSMEEILKITGDPLFAEYLERLAFNALPAQISDDFRLHQYFQQANQVQITMGAHNFDVSNDRTNLLMGFLTGYPCCLSNLHQGWPKFTGNLWYRNADGGLAAMAYAPCRVVTSISGTEVRIREITEYPFDERIRLEVEMDSDRPLGFPVDLRIPSWAGKGLSVSVNGQEQKDIVPGTVLRLDREWQDGDSVVLYFPMEISIGRWYENAAAVERGPLVYALKIKDRWIEKSFTEDTGHGSCYWEVYPEEPWNYALIKSDIADPSASFRVEKKSGYPESGWYWSPDGAPVLLKVRAARLPEWTLYNGSAGPVPYSQIPGKCASGNSAYRSDGTYEEITLIPYGCTTLRVSEFPVVNE